MTEIRPFVFTDLKSITEIYTDEVLHGTASYEVEAPSEYNMRARFVMLVANRLPVLVAVDGADVLGYAYIDFFRKRPASQWMVENSIYIARQARGRGVGRKLLSKLIEHSAAMGYRQMVGVIGDGSINHASINLHKSLGFIECGRIKASGFKQGRWLDMVFMQRSLNEGTQKIP